MYAKIVGELVFRVVCVIGLVPAMPGHSVDFVGSQDSGAGSISDSDHEGHGGWRIDQIDDIAECTVRSNRPNVVLLHVGTNDMNRNFDVGNAHHRLAALIRKITNAAPETTVLVSGLVPSQDDAINARIAAYNSRIPDMARTLAAEGRRVRALSMGAVTEADLRDKLHPGRRGYDKMGRVFHGALSAALRERVIASPVAGNPSACQMPQPANPAEGWNASSRSPRDTATPVTGCGSPTWTATTGTTT